MPNNIWKVVRYLLANALIQAAVVLAVSMYFARYKASAPLEDMHAAEAQPLFELFTQHWFLPIGCFLVSASCYFLSIMLERSGLRPWLALIAASIVIASIVAIVNLLSDQIQGLHLQQRDILIEFLFFQELVGVSSLMTYFVRKLGKF